MGVTVSDPFVNPPDAPPDPNTEPGAGQPPGVPVDPTIAGATDPTQEPGQKTTGFGGQPLTAEQASFQNQNPQGGSFPGSTVDQARFNGPGGPGVATAQGPSLGNGAPLTPEQAAFQNTYPNGGSFNNQGQPIGGGSGGGGPTSLPGAGGGYELMAAGKGWQIGGGYGGGMLFSDNTPQYIKENQGYKPGGYIGPSTLVPGGEGPIAAGALGLGGNSNLLGLSTGPGNIPPEGRNFGRGPTMTNEAPGYPNVPGGFGGYGNGMGAGGRPINTAGFGFQPLQGADPRFSITARQDQAVGGGTYGPTGLPGLAGYGGGPIGAGPTGGGGGTVPTSLAGAAGPGGGTGGGGSSATGAGGHVIRDATGNIIGVASANGYYDQRFQSTQNILNNTQEGDPLAYQSDLVLAAAGDPRAKAEIARIASLPDYFNSQNAVTHSGLHDQQILNRSQNEAGIMGNVAAIQNMGNQRTTINGAPVSNENALMTPGEHTQLMAELVAQGATNPHLTFDNYGNLTIGYTSASGVARTLTNADGTPFSQQDYGRALAQLQAGAPAAGGGGGGRPRGGGGYAPPAAPPAAVAAPEPYSSNPQNRYGPGNLNY